MSSLNSLRLSVLYWVRDRKEALVQHRDRLKAYRVSQLAQEIAPGELIPETPSQDDSTLPLGENEESLMEESGNSLVLPLRKKQGRLRTVATRRY